MPTMISARYPSFTRFLPVGALAIAQPVISWSNPLIVRGVNGWLHLVPTDERGWTLYTALRLVLFLALIWSILRLRTSEVAAKTSSPSFQLNPRPLVHAKRIPQFDPLMGLRALAALMVLMGHYFMVVFPYVEPADGIEHTLYRLVRSCPWGGVWVFFTLSGYLMAKGFATGRYELTPSSVFSFYRNRFLRIVPLYAGGLFFVSVLVSPAIFHPRHFWQMLEMLLFDYRGDLPMNPIGALWSVSTEVQFYFLVPFLFALLAATKRRLGRCFPGLMLLILMAGFLFRRFIATHYLAKYFVFGYTPLVSNLDLFLTGMCISLFSPNRTENRTSRFQVWMLPLLAVMIYTISVVLTARYYRPEHSSDLQHFWIWAPTVMCVLAGAYIAFAQVVGHIALGQGLRKAAFALISRTGVLTYALYVFHPQIYIQFRSSILPATVLRASQAFAYFPLVLCLVWLTAEAAYRFVEQPFEQRRHVPGSALLNAP